MDHFLQDCPTFHDHRKSYSIARSTDTNLVTVDHLLKDCLTYCYPRENHRGSHTKGLFPWSTMIHNDTTSWPTSTREKSTVAHTPRVCFHRPWWSIMTRLTDLSGPEKTTTWSTEPTPVKVVRLFCETVRPTVTRRNSCGPATNTRLTTRSGEQQCGTHTPPRAGENS